VLPVIVRLPPAARVISTRRGWVSGDAGQGHVKDTVGTRKATTAQGRMSSPERELSRSRTVAKVPHHPVAFRQQPVHAHAARDQQRTRPSTILQAIETITPPGNRPRRRGDMACWPGS
jgi:hypothetical protein